MNPCRKTADKVPSQMLLCQTLLESSAHLHFQLKPGNGGIALLQLLLHSGDAAARLLYLLAARQVNTHVLVQRTPKFRREEFVQLPELEA